ncbi:hypothetical protein ACFX13_029694 [Malus domestica]
MPEVYDSSSLVNLNVAGKKFCTTVGTLTQRQPDSMLAAIDGEIPKLEDSQYAELVKEAKYYLLFDLVDGILDVLDSKEDTASYADFTRTDVIKYIHSQKSCRCSSNKNYLQGVNLSGLNISKLDLSEVNFSSACLRNVSISGANLQSANFKHVDAEGATFDDANLCGSTFYGANLRGASFVGANLRGASLMGAKNFDLYDLSGASGVEYCSF